MSYDGKFEGRSEAWLSTRFMNDAMVLLQWPGYIYFLFSMLSTVVCSVL